MRLDPGGTWTFSPTDLATFVRCEHAVHLRRQKREGTLVELAPPGKSIRADMLARRGGEHEDAWLAHLRSEGKSIVEIDREQPDAVARTIDAMRSGADVIYQAALASDGWSGYADFLERVDTPSDLGEWSYEVADTKLSLSVQPYFVLQLGIYSRLVAAIQGRFPERMHLILGDDSRQTFRCDDFAAYLEHVTARFHSGFASGAESLPYPVEYCGLCEWNRHCWRHLVHLDHLSLVANIRRDHVQALERAGVPSLETLARSDPRRAAGGINPPIYERLAHQARLQLRHRETGQHEYEFLDIEDRRGFLSLPKPADGDMFFDIEADPFEDLTYLFGIAFTENGQTHYRPFWAHNPEEERKAFEGVVDFMLERRAQHPGSHIYHYGPADPGTLKRLMGRYGTREEEIDDLLRAQAFVDLLAVVRQAIRISHPSYSLKKVETFYMERESEGVIDAGGAIVAYEEWLQAPSQEKLDEIEAYNREDCVSTVKLREWLCELREELERDRGAALPWREPKEREPTNEEREKERLETDDLSRALLERLPEDRTAWSEAEHARWLLAHLLHYHRRDEKPDWWEYFERQKATLEELVEDREVIALLTPTGKTRRVRKSIATEFRFEEQEHKLSAGKSVYDPYRQDEKGRMLRAGRLESIDDQSNVLEIARRAPFRADELPRAVSLNDVFDSTSMREALRRIARAVLEDGWDGARYRAATDMLLRRPPRVTGREPGAPLQGAHVGVALAQELARGLDASYLFVQGPPGSGKTYVGARVIIDLLRRGKRIGVTARSHKAIENLLHEIEAVADEQEYVFDGLKCSSEDDHKYVSKLPDGRIVDSRDKFPRGEKPDADDPAIRLVAGTQWHFSDGRREGTFDVLVIDEAGQMSLADALAASTAARSVILLGDPLQLAQVSRGTHPEGCGASVLEHLLGAEATIPKDRGLFLEQTWRMHPDVSRFISEVVYAGRLESEAGCTRRRIDAPEGALTGTGLRFHPMEHAGNSQRSVEEAEWIAASVAAMLAGGRFTESDGSVRPLTEGDVLVVTPYNAQVAAIRRTLDERGLSGVRAGTVDKFQGQQAPVVFFSMATSSGDNIPRSLDFLFSRNRLNVAISRAQCLAVLVASPRLLDVNCSTVEQMKLVNALCRFVAMAATPERDP